MSEDRSNAERTDDETAGHESKPLLSRPRHAHIWGLVAAVVAVLVAIWRCA